MKIFKFRSVRFTFYITIFYAFISVYMMNALSMIVVDNIDTLIKNIIFLFIIYIVNHILYYLKLYGLQISTYYLSRFLGENISNHYKNMKYNDFIEKTSGERSSLYLNDRPKVIVLCFNKLVDIVYYICILFFVSVMLFKINYLIFVITTGLIILMFLIPKFFSKGLSSAINEAQNVREKFLGRITEMMSTFFVFFATSSGDKFIEKSNLVDEEYSDGITKVEIFAAKMSVALNYACAVLVLIDLGIASVLVIQGKLHSGVLLSILGLIPLIGEASQVLFTNIAFYKSGINFYKQKFGDIDNIYPKELTKPFLFKHKVESSVKIRPIIKNIDKIKTESLTINFKDKKIGIKDIEIENGKKYLLIGESGTGKSALLKTILGAYSDYEGNIIVDGELKLKEKELYDKIAYLGQDSNLFKGTIKENICIGNDEADCVGLLKRVGLEEYGPDYKVDENGRNFSDGQKQRIALARTLALSRNILFLDEITSNLDKNTADSIEKFIFESNYTIIYVTHKINDYVTEKADEIINLSEQ